MNGLIVFQLTGQGWGLFLAIQERRMLATSTTEVLGRVKDWCLDREEGQIAFVGPNSVQQGSYTKLTKIEINIHFKIIFSFI